jgi:hypothetical protein
VEQSAGTAVRSWCICHRELTFRDERTRQCAGEKKVVMMAVTTNIAQISEYSAATVR